MAHRCEICGRGTTTGYSIIRRGKAKYLGGVGRKVTGKSKRTFEINVQLIRINDKGTVRRAKICTRCLKGGTVKKAV